MSTKMSGPPEAGPSDADLLTAVREGDTDRFGVLYERHVSAATGLARQLIADAASVEDVVAETFTKVLDAIRRGSGPTGAFRPYLLTAVRRSAYDRFRDTARQVVTDDEGTLETPVDFEDPAVADLERSLVARAFNSLPERWQVVLWHTEVEEAKPADVAPLLGISANGVAALAYRAREGLRQAYLQEHLASGAVAEECREHHDKLGGYVRGGLAKRASLAVGLHLEGCDDCTGVVAELTGLNEALKGILAPIILGPAAAGYLGAVKGGFLSSWITGWWQRAPKQQQAAAVGAAAVVVAAGLAFALVSDEKPQPPPRIAVAPPPPPQRPEPEPKPEPKPQPPPPAPQPPPPTPPAEKPSPAPKPTPEPPSPVPTPKPSPVPTPIITVRVEPVGALVPGRPGIVAVRVQHGGRGAAVEVEADVKLPRGVLYRSAARGGRFAGPTSTAAGGDWVCRPGEVEVGCVRAPLRPGTASTLYLGVDVGPDAQPGEPPSVTVRAGRASARAGARSGVIRDGMPARYAADGKVRTVAVGNALLTCPPRQEGCAAAAERKGTRRDNDLWEMRPVDADDRDDTHSSSAARLDVPSGGNVRWAGLYWSGGARGDDRVPTARLRGPGGAYGTVRATECGRDALPGYPAYQAFADVTERVRTAGGGSWWVADTPALHGRGKYAGWALVVVVDDPAAPPAQAMVLDGVRALYRDSTGITFPLAGMLSAGMPGEVSVVAWEGDADLPGDSVRLGGRALTPQEGEKDPGNALDGSAVGAEGPAQSFGTDVDRFTAKLPDRPKLQVSTGHDAVLTGVVGVTAETRS